jgi:hypothetical protein
MDPIKITSYVTAAVTVASILANFIPPHTVVGKALHWIALNIRVGQQVPPTA